MVIAAGFVLRAMAGAYAIDVPISPWLYVVTALGALFIAVTKRRAEVTLLEGAAPEHRSTLLLYTPALLDQMTSMVTASTIIAYALYTFTAENVPANHTMMLTIPFVAYGIFRYLFLVADPQRGRLARRGPAQGRAADPHGRRLGADLDGGPGRLRLTRRLPDRSSASRRTGQTEPGTHPASRAHVSSCWTNRTASSGSFRSDGHNGATALWFTPGGGRRVTRRRNRRRAASSGKRQACTTSSSALRLAAPHRLHLERCAARFARASSSAASLPSSWTMPTGRKKSA